MHDARGNQTQNGLVAVDDKRMACVMAAVKANNAVHLFGKPVDNLTLTLVTPLGADHHDVL